MSDEQENEQSEIETRISKIDKACDTLLKLIESNETSDAQKGRLFAQVVSWAKVKDKLIPPDNGSKLKEMQDDLANGKRSRGAQRTAASAAAASGAGRNTDGHKIRKIIASLPSYGGVAAGNQKDSQREGGSDDSDSGHVGLNGGSDGDADDDGAPGVH